MVMNKQTLSLVMGALIGAGVVLAVVGIVRQQSAKGQLSKPGRPAAEQVSKAEITPKVLAPRSKGFEFQKGMSYVAWTGTGYSNSNSVKSMEEMAGLGVEWVSLNPTWYQDRVNATEVYPLRDKTPSDESLLFAIKKLHGLGLKIMLKPHLDIVRSQGRWRGEIGFADPAGWQAWFASYTDFILHYARLAQQEQVQIFCIGTELTNAAVNQGQFWKQLISRVREVYDGDLTYAANWHEEFDYIEFWDELDYAGLDPYFPLISSDRPTREQLVKTWQGWFAMVEQWQAKVDKPLIFTEAGYKSSVGATDEPWKHASGGEVDLQLQADCYQALLENFYQQPWFYGVYWWHWGVNPRMGGASHRGFTPQNKPAKEVIKTWYNKPIAEKKY